MSLFQTIYIIHILIYHIIYLQTSKFSGAIFKSFPTQQEAHAFVQSRTSAASATTSYDGGTSQNRKRPRNEYEVALLASKQQKKMSTNNNAHLQITIHFDGGSRGNPGVAGAGAEVVVVSINSSSTSTKRTTYMIREYCGVRETNNFAEYKGLLAGLKQAKLCIEQYTANQLTFTTEKPLFQLQISGDSKLIIEQQRGARQCKHANIKPLFHQSQQLITEMENMDSNSTVLYDHVYREQNKVADGLANEAMDTRKSWTTTSSGDGSDSPDDERKQSAVAVARKSKNINAPKAAVTIPKVARSNKSGAAPASKQKQEVIDVDDSDEEDPYYC